MPMIEIKIIVALLTLIIGGYYSRKELRAMKDIMFERDYIELSQMHRMAVREMR